MVRRILAAQACSRERDALYGVESFDMFISGIWKLVAGRLGARASSGAAKAGRCSHCGCSVGAADGASLCPGCGRSMLDARGDSAVIDLKCTGCGKLLTELPQWDSCPACGKGLSYAQAVELVRRRNAAKRGEGSRG